jgi:hypothetical protein
MRHPMLGSPPAMMSVPTHFFKVILIKEADSRVSCAAFVLPNAPIPKEVPLRRFVVPLTDLEMVSGLEFFKRGLLGNDRVAYEKRESAFLEATSRQLPGAGKIPSLPAAHPRSCTSSSDSMNVGRVTSKWVEVKHLCETTACELKPSKWDR